MFASHNLLFDPMCLSRTSLLTQISQLPFLVFPIFSQLVLLIQFGIKTPTFKSMSELGGLSFHGDQWSSGSKLSKI